MSEVLGDIYLCLYICEYLHTQIHLDAVPGIYRYKLQQSDHFNVTVSDRSLEQNLKLLNKVKVYI